MVITEEQWKEINEKVDLVILREDRMHEHMVDKFDRLLEKSDSIIEKVNRLGRLVFARSAEEVEKVILEFPLDERKQMVAEMMQTLNQKFGL